MARHALPNLVEASLIPLAVFYGALSLIGVWGALLAALGWSYAAIVRRLVTRKPLPGLLLLGAAGLTARTAVAALSGSVFVYFLQPTLTTGSPAHPTISILLDPLLGSQPGRSVGFAAWLGLGWLLVRR